MTLSHPPSVPRTCPQDVVRIGHRWQDAEVSTGTPTTLAVEPDPRCSSGVITLAQLRDIYFVARTIPPITHATPMIKRITPQIADARRGLRSVSTPPNMSVSVPP